MSATGDFDLYARVSLDDIREEIETYKEANDPDYEQTIDDLQLVFKERVEHVASRYKNKTAMARMIREEMKVMRARLQAIEADADRDKRYLDRNLTPGERFQGVHCDLGWRRTQTVKVDDPTVIPEVYQVVHISADKRALAQVLTTGGEVEGAELLTHLRLQIR